MCLFAVVAGHLEQELGGASFEKNLVTRTREGIDVRPLYTRDSSPLDDSDDPGGVPGRWPFTRGRATDAPSFWRCAVHDEVDVDMLRDAIRRDLDGGADALTLQFDRAVRLGYDAGDDEASEHVGKDGVSLYSIADIERLFDGLDIGALRWRLDGQLLEQLQWDDKNAFDAYFPDAATWVEDLEWVENQLRINYFKRVQAPPIVVLSKRAFGFDLRETQGPAYRPRAYDELKAQVLGS